MLTSIQDIQPHKCIHQQSEHLASHKCSPAVRTLSLTAVLTSSQYIQPYSSAHQQSVHSASQQYSSAVRTFSLTAVLTSSQYVEPHSITHQQSIHWASQQYSPAVSTFSHTAVLTWNGNCPGAAFVPFTILTFEGAPSTKRETPFFQFLNYIWRFLNTKCYGCFC